MARVRDWLGVRRYRRTGGICGGRVCPPHAWDKRPRLRLARDRNALCHLVSVVDATGQVRMWPLWWHLSKAWHGPALMDMLPGRGGRRLTLGKIPEGGLHVDVPRKTVGAWQTADTMGIFQALPNVWRGWQTECWEDRFEEQVIRCEGRSAGSRIGLGRRCRQRSGVDRHQGVSELRGQSGGPDSQTREAAGARRTWPRRERRCCRRLRSPSARG